jgi:alpha-galactosidase
VADANDQKGHAGHVQRADDRGLAGTMPRPIKITMLGAGSMFTPELANDVLRIPGNAGGTIALVDIDTDRLTVMHQLIEKLIGDLGADDWSVTSTTDRTEALPESDYIVNCIEVSGVDCVRFDNDIPASHGVDQCIGDTIGPGGLMKALRTVPVWLEVLDDAQRLCPDAWVLNYTNPMSMMCLAAGRSSPMTVVGLCHSVQATGRLLAWRAGVRYRDLVWECAGINHLAWFTRVESDGQDLYPLLMDKAHEDLAGNPADEEDPGDLVRKDMMVHFGAFITESSGHLSEYVPYYRPRAETIEQYCGPEYDGESGFYAREWPGWREAADATRSQMLEGETAMDRKRSWEYASWIIEAREKDQPYRIHGNVMNAASGGSLITNLPPSGCVEVACYIDRSGIHPTRYGALPPQMAALCASNMSFFDLGAQAAIERDLDVATHALMLDPLTSACCAPAEIARMGAELFKAEAEWLPGFA